MYIVSIYSAPAAHRQIYSWKHYIKAVDPLQLAVMYYVDGHRQIFIVYKFIIFERVAKLQKHVLPGSY